MTHTDKNSYTSRKQYREIAAQRYHQEYGEDWNTLSLKLQSKYLAKVIQEDVDLQPYLIDQGIDKFKLAKLEEELKAKGDNDPHWHAYVALRKEQDELKKANANKQDTSLFRKILAWLLGFTIAFVGEFVVIWFLLGPSVSSVKEGGTFPVLLVQYFIVLAYFPLLLLSALLGVFIGSFIYSSNKPAEKSPKNLKLASNMYWSDWKEDIWWIIGGLAVLIVVPFIIWWFCVDITPWFIFFGPGLILATFTGKRR